MARFCRRQFLQRGVSVAAAGWLAPTSWAYRLGSLHITNQKFSATDTVTIGGTGIRTSRLAMGTGTVGSGHHSNQTALGLEGLSRLLQNGYDNGLRFFDAADSYGSHPHVADALKHVDRSKVTVLTKSWARSGPEMRAAGKGIVGMKILGQGDLRQKQNEAIRYALGLGVLDAFTVGAESIPEQMDLIHRVAAA